MESNYLSYVKGKGDIWAGVVAASVNHWGDEITTFRLHYPRFIHSELMTHRVFSRNASSSRAIPVKTMLEQVKKNPAMPIHWGKNQPGMQASVENDALVVLDYMNNKENDVYLSATTAWEEAVEWMAYIAKAFADAGYHKQVVNRLLEPFQFMNVVVTATEFTNWFGLRTHEDADPNIRELAHCMLNAYVDAKYLREELVHGEWHTPYVDHRRDDSGHLSYWSGNEELFTQSALKVSSSCAAQASYRKLDTSVEKAENIYERLVSSKPLHASPFEHQATPFSEDERMLRQGFVNQMLSAGLPGADQMMMLGNFRGWTQHRKLLAGENITEFQGVK